MKFTEKNFLHYIVLIIGLSLVLYLFFLFRSDYAAKVVVSLLGSIFYTSWGIIHHAVEKRLSRLIAFEYALFGLFSFLLIVTALNI